MLETGAIATTLVPSSLIADEPNPIKIPQLVLVPTPALDSASEMAPSPQLIMAVSMVLMLVILLGGMFGLGYLTGAVMHV